MNNSIGIKADMVMMMKMMNIYNGYVVLAGINYKAHTTIIK